jgi:hypothetical protein
MANKKKITTITILSALVLLGVAATHKPVLQARNLKVLPKDISDKKLDSIMDSYNVALGVGCDFCHVKVKSTMWGKPDSIDYASDKEPMKENARDMMRMTIEINSKHFYFDKNERPEYLKTVTCKTCHRGEPFPEHD